MSISFMLYVPPREAMARRTAKTAVIMATLRVKAFSLISSSSWGVGKFDFGHEFYFLPSRREWDNGKKSDWRIMIAKKGQEENKLFARPEKNVGERLRND
jgi:hypothetical protein